MRCFIINAGRIAKYGWKLISPFLDANTKEKVRIFDGDYAEEVCS